MGGWEVEPEGGVTRLAWCGGRREPGRAREGGVEGGGRKRGSAYRPLDPSVATAAGTMTDSTHYSQRLRAIVVSAAHPQYPQTWGSEVPFTWPTDTP